MHTPGAQVSKYMHPASKMCTPGAKPPPPPFCRCKTSLTPLPLPFCSAPPPLPVISDQSLMCKLLGP